MSVPAIGFQPVESNYRQSMIIITEGNISIDNVKVKVEMTDTESKRSEEEKSKNYDVLF